MRYGLVPTFLATFGCNLIDVNLPGHILMTLVDL